MRTTVLLPRWTTSTHHSRSPGDTSVLLPGSYAFHYFQERQPLRQTLQRGTWRVQQGFQNHAINSDPFFTPRHNEPTLILHLPVVLLLLQRQHISACYYFSNAIRRRHELMHSNYFEAKEIANRYKFQPVRALQSIIILRQTVEYERCLYYVSQSMFPCTEEHRFHRTDRELHEV